MLALTETEADTLERARAGHSDARRDLALTLGPDLAARADRWQRENERLRAQITHLEREAGRLRQRLDGAESLARDALREGLRECDRLRDEADELALAARAHCLESRESHRAAEAAERERAREEARARRLESALLGRLDAPTEEEIVIHDQRSRGGVGYWLVSGAGRPEVVGPGAVRRRALEEPCARWVPIGHHALGGWVAMRWPTPLRFDRSSHGARNSTLSAAPPSL